MAHTYRELKEMTVARLREIAQGIEHEALHGFMTMHKEQLVPALCKALGIDAHEHHVATLSDKGRIKGQIREMKKQRLAVLQAHDAAKLRALRRRIHDLKRELRKAAK